MWIFNYFVRKIVSFTTFQLLEHFNRMVWLEGRTNNYRKWQRPCLIIFFTPKHFWAELVNITYYSQNKIYVRPILKKTSYELWKGPNPNISYFHHFRCQCFILNTKDNLGKFVSKCDNGILFGYSETLKAPSLLRNYQSWMSPLWI